MSPSAFHAAWRALTDSRRSRVSIERFQLERLRALARHAFDRVPYYHERFRSHGVHPDDIGSLDDVSRLPIAERLDMRELPARHLIARGFDEKRLIPHRTSGSTGVPFTIRRTWFEERLLNAFRYRELFRQGLRLTDSRARVALSGSAARWPSLPRPLGWLRSNSAFFSCLAPPSETLDAMARLRPDVITGFAGSIARLASEATEEHLRSIRPRLITAGAETLTPLHRRIIASAFGARVVETYSAHECNLIARQCPESTRLHVLDSSVLVEILKDGRPAEPGEAGAVFVTPLHSFAMPFIRYRIGDLATRGPTPCPCGAPCSTIQSILGRSVELFEMPDGSKLHPFELVLPLVRGASWLRRYQIVQRSLHLVHARALPAVGFQPSPEEIATLGRALSEAAPRGVTVTLEIVADLLPEANGKFRPYYSELTRP